MSFLSSPRHQPETEFTIVLDMDETLLSAIFVEKSSETPLEKVKDIYSKNDLYDIRIRSFRVPFYDPIEEVGSGIKYDCWGITRPNLHKFLKFAFRYFKKVVVWSAGRFAYVKRLTREITKDTHQFDLIWTYNDCTKGGLGKPLNKLISEHPELGDISKIFIVDDKASSIADNKENGIIIPPYNPGMEITNLRKDDQALIKLMEWFKTPEVRNATDIRKLNKKNIF